MAVPKSSPAPIPQSEEAAIALIFGPERAFSASKLFRKVYQMALRNVDYQLIRGIFPRVKIFPLIGQKMLDGMTDRGFYLPVIAGIA